jgi:hypothetical protein
VLAFQVRFTLCCGGAVPVPVKLSTGVLTALLTNDSLSEAVPLAWGVKVTVTCALCPAAILSGKDIPLRANSEVPVLAEEMVTLEPLALRVAVMLLLCPTTTLPKLSVAGLMVNWPAAVPVPDSEIARLGFEAFETTEMLPLKLPADVGAKTPPKVKLCPGIRVIGRLSPLMA